MPLTKFREGDRVRIREAGMYGHTDNRSMHVGKTGRVMQVPDTDQSGTWFNRSYVVQLDEGDHGRWTKEELERICPPDALREGFTPLDLADYVDAFIHQCRNRVLGVGAEQYSNGARQRFEDMTPVTILEAAREEVQDMAVYAAMVDIRLQRQLAALRELDEKGITNG